MEGFVGEGVVDAYADDLCFEVGESCHAVAEGAHFFGAGACECADEECEDCFLSLVVVEACGFHVCVG